jgi:hypothetical protein
MKLNNLIVLRSCLKKKISSVQDLKGVIESQIDRINTNNKGFKEINLNEIESFLDIINMIEIVNITKKDINQITIEISHRESKSIIHFKDKSNLEED